MTDWSSTSEAELAAIVAALRRCRICRDAPDPLPHEPRPIIQGSRRARLCIASQAPGVRAHRSGTPFRDPSGDRLRAWLGLDETAFYDPDFVAIVPMGHCFPGHDPQGGDLPPRRECAPRWRLPVFGALPGLEIVLAVGSYAQRWHMGRESRGGLTATVGTWREHLDRPGRPRVLPLPHPSWRNSGWLRRNPWFEADVLPALRAEVAALRAQQVP